MPINTIELIARKLLFEASIAWGIISRNEAANKVPTAKLTKLVAKADLASLKMILASKRLVNPPAKETPMIQYSAIVYPKKNNIL